MRNCPDKKEIPVLVSKRIISIGIKVRCRRKEMKMTLFDLAVDSECCLSVISDLERGVSEGMTISTLTKIASALEMTPESLFCE